MCITFTVTNENSLPHEPTIPFSLSLLNHGALVLLNKEFSGNIIQLVYCIEYLLSSLAIILIWVLFSNGNLDFGTMPVRFVQEWEGKKIVLMLFVLDL